MVCLLGGFSVFFISCSLYFLAVHPVHFFTHPVLAMKVVNFGPCDVAVERFTLAMIDVTNMQAGNLFC